jgi:hypothetical protein
MRSRYRVSWGNRLSCFTLFHCELFLTWKFCCFLGFFFLVHLVWFITDFHTVLLYYDKNLRFCLHRQVL